MLHRRDISGEIWDEVNVNLPGSAGHTRRNSMSYCVSWRCIASESGVESGMGV